jgi:hypothetical protein
LVVQDGDQISGGKVIVEYGIFGVVRSAEIEVAVEGGNDAALIADKKEGVGGR